MKILLKKAETEQKMIKALSTGKLRHQPSDGDNTTLLTPLLGYE